MKTALAQIMDDFYERSLPSLVPRIKELPQIANKADVIIGMRRTGKTYFCYQKIEELLGNTISKNQILYLNFEDDRLLDFKLEHFQLIIDIYYAKFPDNKDKQCYFFFDEIQNINQWEKFIRRLIDTEKLHLFLTGSSSKLLSKEIATSLRGRSITTEIFPFSFNEYLKFHNYFTKPPTTFGAKTVSRLRNACDDYLKVGGFAEVQNLTSHLRMQVLQGYIDSVLLRDIVERYNVSNILVLKHLLHSINSNPGGQFSVNKFYNTLKSMGIKCTKSSLYQYLDYLEEAYIIYRVPIYSHSNKVRIVNPAKIYLIDTGLINAEVFNNGQDNSHLLENLVFMHLRRMGLTIEYVQNKNGYEVDFLTTSTLTGEKNLIQVSWEIGNTKTLNRELRGLKTAMENLNISSGTIITWDEEKDLDDNITAIPVWKWLVLDGL